MDIRNPLVNSIRRYNMKKVLGFFTFMLLASSAYGISPRSEDDNVLLHYNNTSVTESTNVILVDLSSVTAYNTRHTGSINISRIKARIDKTDDSTGTVKIGVLNYVHASTGSVSYFFECPFSNQQPSTTTVVCDELYSPSLIRTDVVPSSTADTDGSTPYIATTDITSGSSNFQNDVNNYTVLGQNEKPAVGDLILTLTHGNGGQYDVVLDVFYHSVR